MWILPKQLIVSSGFSATEGIISDSNEQSQICAASLLVRSKPTRLRTWFQKWKRDRWTRFLFGRIAKPSRAKNFVDWWTSLLLHTHARDSVRPVNAKEKAILDFYGLGCSGSASLFDRAECFSRMWMDMSRLDSPQSSAIWKRRVTELRRTYSARQKSVLRTNESECSSSGNWQTPRAHESGDYNYQKDGRATASLTGQAKNWPSPNVCNAHQGQNEHDGKRGQTLKGAARGQNWGTPRVTTNGGHPSPEVTGKGSRLENQVSNWPTPSVHDTKGANGSEQMSKERPHMDQLPNAVIHGQNNWATPGCGTPNQLRGLDVHPDKRRAKGRQVNLTDQMVQFGQPDLDNFNTTGNPHASQVLNADWVETLMGVPKMWSDCDYLEMESCQPQPNLPIES